MDIDKLKQRLQSHFTDGLVTIIGAGLSAAEGIPGMVALANHLIGSVPSTLTSAPSLKMWDSVKAELGAGVDLETALLNNPPDEDLESVIVTLTAQLLLEEETKIIQEVIQGKRELHLSRLFKHMRKPNTGIPIITTNYDRLVEVAAESVGLGVDTLFVGHYLGSLDPKQSKYCLCRGVRKLGKKAVHLKFTDHIVLLKPHGSFGWYQHNDNPVASPIPLSEQPLIITPGLNKFRGGYNRPFDTHRERANNEIDKADRFLIIGYGFNDDHLQIHLEQQLRSGKQALILTRSLSDKAKGVVSESSGAIALCLDKAKSGTRVVTSTDDFVLPSLNLWDVDVFINEVLEP